MLCECFWYKKTERETNKHKESMVLLHWERVMWCIEPAMILMLIPLYTVTSRDFHAIANQFVTQTSGACAYHMHERNYFDDIITSMRAYSQSHTNADVWWGFFNITLNELSVKWLMLWELNTEAEMWCKYSKAFSIGHWITFVILYYTKSKLFVWTTHGWSFDKQWQIVQY